MIYWSSPIYLIKYLIFFTRPEIDSWSHCNWYSLSQSDKCKHCKCVHLRWYLPRWLISRRLIRGSWRRVLQSSRERLRQLGFQRQNQKAKYEDRDFIRPVGTVGPRGCVTCSSVLVRKSCRYPASCNFTSPQGKHNQDTRYREMHFSSPIRPRFYLLYRRLFLVITL